MGYIKEASAIPPMTSNTAPSGKVSVSTFSDGYLHYAYRVFDKATSTYWQAQAKSGWAKYEFDLPIVIAKYSLRATGTINGAPKDWTFEGSNDDQNWTILDSQSNITNWTSGMVQDYVISNQNKYKFYRLNVVTTKDNLERISLSEIDMFEYIYDYRHLISTGPDTVSFSHFPESNPMPIMTGGTVEGFTVTESLINAGSYNGWKAFDGLINSNTACWAAPKVPTATEPQWIMIKLDQKRRINKYDLTGQFGSPLRSPKDWTFEGSIDGVNWTVLDTRSNVTGWTDNVFKTFSTSNEENYLYYRIMITANNGDSGFVCIGEMKIYQLESSTLTYVPGLDSLSFVRYGMSRNVTIDLHLPVREVSIISNIPEVLGGGKVFKQKVDTALLPIKGVSVM